MSKHEVVHRQAGELVSDVKNAAITTVGGLGVLWAVSLVNWVFLGSALDAYAIVPRTLSGLFGIFAAPFLHVGLVHLVSNSIMFAILTPLMMARNRRDFYAVALITTITSGLGAWLLGGAGTVHLGASGVLFGFLGFLMARGFFERSLSAIALSLVMVWAFGGLVWAIFPILAGVGISWQAHLFGFLGGIWAARVLGRELRKKGRA